MSNIATWFYVLIATWIFAGVYTVLCLLVARHVSLRRQRQMARWVTFALVVVMLGSVIYSLDARHEAKITAANDKFVSLFADLGRAVALENEEEVIWVACQIAQRIPAVAQQMRCSPEETIGRLQYLATPKDERKPGQTALLLKAFDYMRIKVKDPSTPCIRTGAPNDKKGTPLRLDQTSHRCRGNDTRAVCYYAQCCTGDSPQVDYQ